eukprot:GFUD01002609.1.p1 GENE.GFUD01002609.1~~GFUD01002609.1.p1  ORF type:complete len:473 (+),score=115.08 GFUD01002609.1:28-1419(+)
MSYNCLIHFYKRKKTSPENRRLLLKKAINFPFTFTRETMSTVKKRKVFQETATVEHLLEDSDDDIDLVPMNDRNKVTLKKVDDSEIVLDDSDSDIEEVVHVSLPKPKKSNPILDEHKVKSIFNKLASKQIAEKYPAQFSSGLKISVSNNADKSSKTPDTKTSWNVRTPKSASVPSTPKILLQKVGSNWHNSSTKKKSEPKYVEETIRKEQNKTVDSDQSNSDEEFAPVERKTNRSKRSKNEDSDTDEDSIETIPKLNSSIRSTRSSVNTTLSDFSEDVNLDDPVELDEEIQQELAKLEALQKILAKHNPDDKRRTSSTSKGRKSQPGRKLSLSKAPKATKSEKSTEIPKPKPPPVPQIIDRGPIDCFDELIIETTAGFPCNFCESKEMFKRRREMIYHMQTKHEEELNAEQKNGDLSGLYPCEICKTAFYSKFILRTHRKAHVKSSEDDCDRYYQYYLRFGQV